MGVIRVWGRNNSINVQKVMWTLAELERPCERTDAGGAFGGLDDPAFAAMNPNRLIPVIDDGGTVVWESNAIVRYLAAKYGSGSLWPEDPATRSAADRWMDWAITTVMPPLTIVFWGLIRTPPEQRDDEKIAAAAETLGGVFGLLDRHLAARSFVAGGDFTLGDIPVGAAANRYLSLDIERPALGRLDDWYRRLKEREAYRSHVMIPLT